ncbi:putative alcohol dehydrogenase [Dendryphion nanum]|uniref:Alcohol dehydrogenase n=1 Tax=Dendryphion nanum TaxID=256645 RepID=A0A9P9J1F3_9PLEO|nr:putative alcohol dehydrogenase [Dendryphion nanum]
MPTQNAIVVTAIGKPLAHSTRPMPQPSPTQVQLRVTVAALNPHDQKGRDIGLFIKENLPAVLANDVTGVVTIVGENVTRFNIGDHVFSQGNMTPDHSQKGLQQYVVVEEHASSKVPDGFSDHDATTIPTNVIPAVVGFFDEINGLGIPAPWTEKAKTFDYAGTQLLIIGGGSNCGRFAVQIAKLAGIGKIVVVGGREDQLKKFGATHIIDRHGGNDVVLERIRKIVGDDLVYAYDAVNHPSDQYLGINALSNSKKGALARLVFSIGEPDTSKILPKNAGYELKNTFGSSHAKAELTTPFWKQLEGYLQKGEIVPLQYTAVNGLDLDKANEVLDAYRDGRPIGQTQFRISRL